MELLLAGSLAVGSVLQGDWFHLGPESQPQFPQLLPQDQKGPFEAGFQGTEWPRTGALRTHRGCALWIHFTLPIGLHLHF